MAKTSKSQPSTAKQQILASTARQIVEDLAFVALALLAAAAAVAWIVQSAST